MKKILSVTLVLVLLFLSIPTHAYAVVPGEDSFGDINTPPVASTDELFKVRSQLMMSQPVPQAQIDAIDAQLSLLGVEKIPAAEVLHKLGHTAQPQFNIGSTADTEWFSERTIVVVRGQQYEAQIITGMWKNGNSPLTNFTAGANVYRQYSGEHVGLINALQVLANEIATASISEKLPILGDMISIVRTLYDVIKAYREGLTPSSIVEDATYGFSIIMGTTVRIVFVKGMGSPDSMQLLSYVGNHVNYNIQISVPIFTVVNGEQVMRIQNDDNPNTVSSYAFDTSACATFAAENYRLLREGRTDVDKRHEIYNIPMILMDERYTASVPFYLPI